MSYHGVTEWEWSFPGGTPATSTDENPVVTYDTPGQYAVTLTAGNGIDEVDLTRTDYITVLASTGLPTPYSQNFDALTTLPPDEWLAIDPDNDEAFEVVTNVGYSGTHSVRLRNYYNDVDDLDEMISTSIDLSTATEATLSFRYAFARRNSDDNDILRVYASADCGTSWSMRKQLTAISSLPTVPDQNSQFIPDDPSDWQYMEVNNINAPFFVSDFRFKFWFTSGGGNNLYLDDINLNGQPVGVEELAISANGLMVVPNPAEESADLLLNPASSGNARIELLDVLGRGISVLHDGVMNAGEQRLTLPVDMLESGLYFVRMVQAGREQVVRFTVR
jgi:PKD repeat protein